jgi:hypothetical protein
MLCPELRGICVRRVRKGGILWGAIVVLFILPVSPALGDIFHLKTGGTVAGLLIATADDNYRIRTTAGTVTIPVSAVESVEAAPTPFEEYDRRVAEAADTPGSHTALAAWCEEQGLKAEQRKHLLRALELDRDYVPARRALGYVRVGTLWIDGRHVGERPAEDAAQNDPERLARAIQNEWRQRIRAYKRSLLDSTLDRLVQEGRAKVLAIKDPLAILPLAQVLSEGDFGCRALLVQALSSFQEDEATLNLAIMGLVDPDGQIRGRALAELARRKDPRVIAQYRAALRQGEDLIVARAAAGLGRLEARAAVPDLIEALTAWRNRWVEVPVDQYFMTWTAAFTGGTVVHLGTASATHAPEVGISSGTKAWGPVVVDAVATSWQLQYVAVLRTEVLEALKRITGQNFGFERDAWRRWYAENQ